MTSKDQKYIEKGRRIYELFVSVDKDGNLIDWKIEIEKLSEAKVAKEIIKRYKP